MCIRDRFGAIALSIIFFFLIYRFDGFGSAISNLTGILMPFIYGAVIAYLLKPVCNSIEDVYKRQVPAPGSVRPKAPSHSPLQSFGRYLAFCSGVPFS